MDEEEKREILLDYPVGTVIELRSMYGEPFMRSGLRGTVQGVGSKGQILMEWDNGSRLSLRREKDSFFIVEDEAKRKVSAQNLMLTYEAAYMKEDVNLLFETINRLQDAGVTSDQIRRKNEELRQKKIQEKLEKGIGIGDEKLAGFAAFLQEIFEPEKNETEDYVSVIQVKVMEPPKIVRIKNTNEAKEELVGGTIEAIYPFDPNVAIVANYNAKINGEDMNRSLIDPVTGETIDVLAGDFFIACVDPVTQSLTDLDQKTEKKYFRLFEKPERFFFQNGRLTSQKMSV